MSVVCVVQARMGSTRLPGKVLADFAGEPMLCFMLRRLSGLDVDRLVVATSDLPADDLIEESVADLDVEVVRGPEDDVLTRFGMVADRHPADHIARLTGDNPFTDPDVVSAVIAAHETAEADYSSNVFPRTFPQGLDTEVIAVGALRQAIEAARSPAEREHVTPYLYRHPERFRSVNLRSGDLLGRERWTVDTADDLEWARGIVRALGSNGAFGWRRILEEVGVQAATHDPLLRPVTENDRGWLSASRPVGLASSTHPAIAWSSRGAPVDDLAHPVAVVEHDGQIAGGFSLILSSARASLEFFPAEAGPPADAGVLVQALMTNIAAAYQVDFVSALAPNESWAQALQRSGFDAAGESWTWTRPR